MNILFTDKAWDDYQYWVVNDRSMIKRVNRLIDDIRRTPFTGIGKPEALKHQLAGYWSRRITDEHRLVYAAEENQVVIITARHRY